jgi:hypothetical protein
MMTEGNEMTQTSKPQIVWGVVYRTGGTVNFQWHRTDAYRTREDAERIASEIRRGGRRAMVVDYQASMSIGLPETFEA